MISLEDIRIKTNAHRLHELGLSGKGVKVAILDSGIDITHPYFEGVQIISSSMFNDQAQDEFQHGTHVASILTTIAPQSIILNIKIMNHEGETQLSTIMRGIEMAIDQGANIINLSVGVEDLNCPDNHPLTKIVEKASNLGIAVVCAAGNSGPGTSPHLPGSCKHAIAVGSMNIRKRTNKWSSRGPCCAWKYPDCVTFGEDILGAFPDNQMDVLSGTSQSAPIISGILALIWEISEKPLTIEEIEYLLSQSCQPIESQEKNNVSGWGSMDAWNFYIARNMMLGRIY